MPTLEEKIEKTKEQIAQADERRRQYAARLKKMEQKYKKQERDKRTHRLIQLGAIVEKVLGRSTSEEELKKLEWFLEDQEKRDHYFTRAMERELKTPVVEMNMTEAMEAVSGDSIRENGALIDNQRSS